MDYRRQHNGSVTFLEHWWLLLCAAYGFVGLHVFNFFAQLTGSEWIWCFVIAVVSAFVGVSLIFFAKLPLYRQRRFLTFGSRALSEHRRPFYRWGYRCAAFAAALLLCLLLSNHG